jgi:hypothetical protein
VTIKLISYNVLGLDEKVFSPLNFIVVVARSVDGLGVLFETARLYFNERVTLLLPRYFELFASLHVDVNHVVATLHVSHLS